LFETKGVGYGDCFIFGDPGRSERLVHQPQPSGLSPSLRSQLQDHVETGWRPTLPASSRKSIQLGNQLNGLRLGLLHMRHEHSSMHTETSTLQVYVMW